jgi:hypothetical protein
MSYLFTDCPTVRQKLHIPNHLQAPLQLHVWNEEYPCRCEQPGPRTGKMRCRTWAQNSKPTPPSQVTLSCTSNLAL